MKEPKQKPDTTGSARIKKKPARMPKELAAKAVLKAKESIKEQAKPTTDADDSPDRYAENRIEQSAEYTVEKAKETLKPQHRRIRRETEQPKEDTHSEPHEREQYRNAPQASEPRTEGRETLEVKTRSEEPLRRNDKPVFQEDSTVQSPQVEQYKRTESAKKIVREKQQNDSQPSVREPERSPSIREMEVPTTAQLDVEPKSIREAEPIRSERLTDTLVHDRSSFEAEPTNSPKIKEYQVRKWQDQEQERKQSEPYKQENREPDLSVSERESIREREAIKEPTIKEKPIQEPALDRTLREETAEQPPRQDVRDYQVKKWREMSKDTAEQTRAETRSIREKPTDIKELERKAPSDRIRDVSSPTHEQETVTEPPSVEAQQRQLSMDKYRKAIEEKQHRNQADRYEPKGSEQKPVSTEAPVQQGSVTPSEASASQDYYPDHRSVRMSRGSESYQPASDARMPRMRSSQTVKEPTRALSKVEKPAKATVKTADKSIKTAEKTVKTAQRTTKATVQTTEKTAEATAKTAQKTAQAAQKAAQVTAKAAQAAAKAAATAAKAAGKAIAAAIKAIVAAIKGLIAAIAAGGWVAVLIIVIIALLAVVLCLCFGVFSSNDTNNGRPMTEAIAEINDDFADSISAKINRFKRKYKPDEVVLVYEGDTDSNGTVMNWPDVLGIYAVGTTTDPENPTDVLMVTPDKVRKLRKYFNEMNSVSYDTEVEEEKVPARDDDGHLIFDDEGEQVMETKTTLTITITVSSMDYRDAASKYNFDESQMEMLREMMRPQYYPMFAELLGDAVGDGGEFGFGLDISPDLPPNELGYQIVQAAKRYIGRSYASMDCSCLARTAYKDCGLTSMNGLSSVRMAQKCKEMGCLFTDPSQLQAGDLIFFARFDPSRGKDYCGDVGRCGTGKCRRWQHIHHVAIYINDEYLIDSTGGDNSVQIRRHWGMDTARWKWVCFGRPTT